MLQQIVELAIAWKVTEEPVGQLPRLGAEAVVFFWMALLQEMLARIAIAPSNTNADTIRLTRGLKKQNELFTFLIKPEVDSNNNHAERQIRPAVIIRKNVTLRPNASISRYLVPRLVRKS